MIIINLLLVWLSVYFDEMFNLCSIKRYDELKLICVLADT